MSADVGRFLSVLAASPAWPRTLFRTQMGNNIDLVSCEYVGHGTYDSDSSLDCTTVVQVGTGALTWKFVVFELIQQDNSFYRFTTSSISGIRLRMAQSKSEGGGSVSTSLLLLRGSNREMNGPRQARSLPGTRRHHWHTRKPD